MRGDIRILLAKELAHCIVSDINVEEIELQVGREIWKELQVYNEEKLDRMIVYFTPVSCNVNLEPKEVRTVLRK